MSEDTVYKAEEKARMRSRTSALPWLLIAGGAVLLLASVLDVRLADYLWPAFVIIPGLVLLYPAYRSTAVSQSKLSFLAVPGAVLLAGGLLLGVMNLAGYFEAWAYLWPLLLAAIAVGVLYITRFDDNPRLELRAHKFIRAMGLLTLGLAAFFELLVYETFNPFIGLGLIILGLYLLRQERRQLTA